jgi:predicted Holliday junction resolvase-like endonuclease
MMGILILFIILIMLENVKILRLKDLKVLKRKFIKIFEILPESIRLKSIQWGMSDTVFRDDLYIWFKNEKLNEEVRKKLSEILCREL